MQKSHCCFPLNRRARTSFSQSDKNCKNHIAASHSRQPLVKGERLVRYEVNAVMPWPCATGTIHNTLQKWRLGALAHRCTNALPPSRSRLTLLPRGCAAGVEPCQRNIVNSFRLGACQLSHRSRQTRIGQGKRALRFRISTHQLQQSGATRDKV